MAEDLAGLIKLVNDILGHATLKKEYAHRAITHRSFVNESGDTELEDNERLEFLGDAVLQLAVSDFLMRHHPSDTEGTLSKYRSSIVNERSLAQAARGIDLGQYISLGKGEELTQGRKKDSILADAFEALVAAVYLSGGIRDASYFVEHVLKSALKNVMDRSEHQDFKTTLQEMTQRILKKIPSYRLVLEEGPDHEKIFETEVWIDGRLYGKGKAKSKKDSEQGAAEEAIQALKAESPSEESPEEP